MKIKSILSVAAVLALCFALLGCSKGIKKDDAKAMAESFLTAVESGDFEAAKTYLHPEKPLDIEKYFSGIESREQIDFQNGIEITRYKEHSFSIYESEVDGSECELEINVIVDGVGLEFNIDIVKNDLGFGIYEFDFDK